MTAFPTLETARCRLVEPREDHLPALLEIFGDEATVRYLQSPVLRDAGACRAMLERWRREAEEGRGFHWAVLPKEAPDAVAGVVAVHYVSPANRRAELGSYLHRSWWGRGLSTELTEALLDHAFGPMGLHRVELRCDPRNAASRAIAAKFGLRLEGVLRDHVFVEGKGFVDEAVHALLASERRP